MTTFVYFNLHKKVFSLRNQKTRKVYAHGNHIVLTDVTFKVSEAGRQRVLREQRKNVHAGVQGDVFSQGVPMVSLEGDNIREATYNPYYFDSFVDIETKQPIHSADIVYLADKRIYYWSTK